MDADVEDLVGTPRTGPRARRAYRSEDMLDQMVKQKAMGVNPKTGGPMVEDMMAGVTISWLSQVFGMDPKTVKAKLADCPPLWKRKAGYVYALPVACQYLVKPALSSEQFLKTIKAADLPASMQQMFWDAALKRQKWEENAGELWRTSAVQEVLGTVFQNLKFTLQLWSDTIERQLGMTQEQRDLIQRLVDELNAELYKGLVSAASKKKTGPSKSELKEMLKAEGEIVPEEDDDYSHLV